MKRTFWTQLVLACLLASQQSIAGNEPACNTSSLAEQAVGFVCKTNSGMLLSKISDDAWESEKYLWQTNMKDLFTHEGGIHYCESIAMMLPSRENFEDLNLELRNEATQMLPKLFLPHEKDTSVNHEFWTIDRFSSAMAHLWTPDTGDTNARYFLDHQFRVLCMREKDKATPNFLP